MGNRNRCGLVGHGWMEFMTGGSTNCTKMAWLALTITKEMMDTELDG